MCTQHDTRPLMFRLSYPRWDDVGTVEMRQMYAEAVQESTHGLETGLNDPSEMAAALASVGVIAFRR